MARRKYNFIQKDGSEFVPDKSKFYKRNRETGEIQVVAVTNLEDVASSAPEDIFLTGNKSDIRKGELIERNMTVLENRIDNIGSSGSTSSGTLGTAVGTSKTFEFVAEVGDYIFTHPDMNITSDDSVKVFWNGYIIPSSVYEINNDTLTLIEHECGLNDNIIIEVYYFTKIETVTNTAVEYDIAVVPEFLADSDGAIITNGLYEGENKVYTQDDASPWRKVNITATNYLEGTNLNIGIPFIDTSVKIKKVATAYYYTSWALLEDGRLFARGLGSSGQFGNGSTSNMSVWAPSPLLTDVADIQGHGYGSLYIIKNDGSLWVTGQNLYGKLGTGNTTNIITPVDTGLKNIVKVVSNYYNTVAISVDGSAYFAGHNAQYQIQAGTGNSTNSDIHTWTKIGDDIIDAGSGQYSLVVLRKDGYLYGTGYDYYYCFNFSTGGWSNGTWRKFGNGDIKKMASNSRATLAVDSTGKLYGCGHGSYGSSIGNSYYTWREIAGMSGKKIVELEQCYDGMAYKTDENVLYASGSFAASIMYSNSATITAYYTPCVIATNVDKWDIDHYDMLYTSLDGDGIIYGRGNNTYNTVSDTSGTMYTTQETYLPKSYDFKKLEPKSTKEIQYNPVKVFLGYNAIIILNSDGKYYVRGNSYMSAPNQSTSIYYRGWKELNTYGRDIIEMVYDQGGMNYFTEQGNLWFGGNKYNSHGTYNGTQFNGNSVIPSDALDYSLNSYASHYINKDGYLFSGGYDYYTIRNSIHTYNNTTNYIGTSKKFKKVWSSRYAVALLGDDNYLYLSGNNNYRQSRYDDGGGTQWLYKDTHAGTNVVDARVTSHSILILKEDGILWGRGANMYGELGQGNTTPTTEPWIYISNNVKRIIQPHNEDLSSYFLEMTDGRIMFCGYNQYGISGTGLDVNSYISELTYTGIQNPIEFKYNIYNAIAILSDGTIVASGSNLFNQIINQTSTSNNRVNITEWTEVDLNDTFTEFENETYVDGVDEIKFDVKSGAVGHLETKLWI